MVLRQNVAAGGELCIFKLSDYQVRGDNWRDWGGINWAEIICSDLVELEARYQQSHQIADTGTFLGNNYLLPFLVVLALVLVFSDSKLILYETKRVVIY